MTDEIERNLNVNYGADHARTKDEMFSSFQAAQHDVMILLDEVYRLRELNRAAGQRLHRAMQEARSNLS